MMDVEILAVLIFLVTYLCIIFFYERKSLVVWASVFVLLALGVLTPRQALESVNLNVILLYTGMMFVSGVFVYSRMPDYLATLFASRTKNTVAAMLVLCAFTSFLSMFLDNVTVVLLMAPVALSIARKCNINLVPLFVGMAISANLQGCATLIGDPPRMLLAGFAGMNFNDFFFVNGTPSIFFAVEVGALTSFVILYFLFRRYRGSMPELKREEYLSVVPSLFVVMLVLLMVVSSSIRHGISYMNGLLCVFFGVISFLWYVSRARKDEIGVFVSKLDWQTGIFLIGVFMLVQSLSVSGIMEDIARWILSVSGGSTFMVFNMIVWISVFISAFVDNIPFLVAMLPVTKLITETLGVNPYLLYFGLLVGASVGGNVTPIGASANIVAMGIVRKQGCKVNFMDFVKIGLPFTVVAVLTGTLFLWILFA
ncbi:MAG: SLC13 family permease [Candidatus Altiarchaeota archaeon]